MKRLLVSYAISNALNRRARLPRFWRWFTSRSADLQAHEQAVRRLDDRLRRTAPDSAIALPFGLHDSIVAAVRRESRLGSRPQAMVSGRPLFTRPWAAAGAVGLILLAACGFLLRLSDSPTGHSALRPTPPSPAMVASSGAALPGTLTLLEELSPYHPGQLTQPLAGQIDAVSADVRDTARFLLASLP